MVRLSRLGAALALSLALQVASSEVKDDAACTPGDCVEVAEEADSSGLLQVGPLSPKGRDSLSNPAPAVRGQADPPLPQFIVEWHGQAYHAYLYRVTSDHREGQEWSVGLAGSPYFMVADNVGGTFIILSPLANERLYHVTPGNKPVHDGDQWSSGWEAKQMTYDGSGGVFVISRSHLYHVTPSNKQGVKWSSGWDAKQMTYDGSGGVFVISRGRLYHVTPGNTQGEEWSSGWDASKMTYDGSGGVFIISRGNLHHATSGNKDGPIWSSKWEPKQMVPDGSGGVFVISRTHLYHVTSDNWGGDRWSSEWGGIPRGLGMSPDGSGGVFVISRGHFFHVTSGSREGDRWYTPAPYMMAEAYIAS